MKHDQKRKGSRDRDVDAFQIGWREAREDEVTIANAPATEADNQILVRVVERWKE